MNEKLLLTFVFLGLVSLFADMTYEGARGVSGAYLNILKGTALVAGAVTIGEFLGYLMRFFSGYLADKLRSSKVLWGLTMLGYVINLVAVPALALAGRWEAALSLFIVERLGKGLRTPARDVILSEVIEEVGRGKGFGLHEVMDQLGAFSGPLVVAFVLGTSGEDYRLAFFVLAIPAAISLAFLLTAYTTYPKVRSVSSKKTEVGWNLGRKFNLFSVSLALMTAGYLAWSLVSYHMKEYGLVNDPEISLMYALAMGVDALVAFPIGYLYDKAGLKSLIMTPILAAAIPVLLLTNTRVAVYLAAAVWGATMSIYETNMRAAIPDLVEPSRRALAYGTYGLIYGAAWMLGGVLAGAIYTLNPTYLIPYVLITELSSLIAMIYLLKSK
ncbi:MAG: MFS transporter [Zestosphaera sp.]